MLLRIEKMRVNCENMQDLSIGSGWEVKQEMKFSERKHKVRQKVKHASKFRYASASELAIITHKTLR